LTEIPLDKTKHAYPRNYVFQTNNFLSTLLLASMIQTRTTVLHIFL